MKPRAALEFSTIKTQLQQSNFQENDQNIVLRLAIFKSKLQVRIRGFSEVGEIIYFGGT